MFVSVNCDQESCLMIKTVHVTNLATRIIIINLTYGS